MSAIDIRDEIEACGLTVPTAIVGLAEQEEVLGQALQGLKSGGRKHGGGNYSAWYSGPNPLPDLLAGLADGTTTPGEIHEALWARAIKNAAAGDVLNEASNLSRDIEAKADTILADSLVSLIEQARPKFEKAIVDLAEVVAVLGPDPKADEVMSLTGKKRQAANTAWDRRVKVEDAVKKAAGIVALVDERSDLGDCKVGWFLPSDTEPAQVLEAEGILDGYRYDFPGLVAGEFDLTLNTPDQAAIVAGALQQAEAEQEEAERQALAAEKQALIDANRARGWK